MRWVPYMAFLAIGVSSVLAVGGIDLSITGIATLSAVIFVTVNYHSNSFFWAFSATALVGTGVGFVNGVMASRGAPPVLTTWALGQILTVVALVFAERSGVPLASTSSVPLTPETAVKVGKFFWLLFVAIYGIEQVTNASNRWCAIGANRDGAIYAGLDVKKWTMYAYCSSGFCAAMACLPFLAEGRAASTGAFIGDEFVAIAIAVLGGTSISGGYRRFLAVVGASITWGIIRKIVYARGADWLPRSLSSEQARVVTAVLGGAVLILSIITGRALLGTTRTIHAEPSVGED